MINQSPATANQLFAQNEFNHSSDSSTDGEMIATTASVNHTATTENHALAQYDSTPAPTTPSISENNATPNDTDRHYYQIPNQQYVVDMAKLKVSHSVAVTLPNGHVEWFHTPDDPNIEMNEYLDYMLKSKGYKTRGSAPSTPKRSRTDHDDQLRNITSRYFQAIKAWFDKLDSNTLNAGTRQSFNNDKSSSSTPSYQQDDAPSDATHEVDSDEKANTTNTSNSSQHSQS